MKTIPCFDCGMPIDVAKWRSNAHFRCVDCNHNHSIGYQRTYHAGYYQRTKPARKLYAKQYRDRHKRSTKKQTNGRQLQKVEFSTSDLQHAPVGGQFERYMTRILHKDSGTLFTTKFNERKQSND